MSVVSLPPRKGFAQRHCVDPRPTRFLPPISGSKYWRSPITLSSIRDDVLAYSNPSQQPDTINFYRAVRHARKAFGLPYKIKMLHLNDVFYQDLPIWSSSPGLPWKTLGYRTKNEVRRDPDAVQSVRRFWHFVKYGRKIRFPDCCAFVRSHICDYGETKVRAIWGYPATITFGEAVFAVPLIRAYQDGNSPLAYGYETAIGGTKRIVNELTSVYKTALDFSSFDKTVPRWLIRSAFDILAENVNFSDYQDHGVADADRMIVMWERLVDYFINTPVRLANGERYLKRSGVASGSYFTQLIDSIVNYILTIWACLEQHGTLPEYVKVLGDDGLIGTRFRFDLDAADDLFRSIGMKLNVKKSATSIYISNLTFLGYEIGYGAPSKPYDRWLAALLFPEIRDSSWDDVASRALGLLYACAGVDDRFDSLARQIIKLRPYDLHLGKGMQRMLDAIGVYDLEKDPPSRFSFMLKLQLF